MHDRRLLEPSAFRNDQPSDREAAFQPVNQPEVVRVWRHVEAARMFVRPLSDTFIEAYLDLEWPAIAGCVGCYRVEGPGMQLFSRIEGSHFTVLGMPLFPLLAHLRGAGLLVS